MLILTTFLPPFMVGNIICRLHAVWVIDKITTTFGIEIIVYNILVFNFFFIKEL